MKSHWRGAGTGRTTRGGLRGAAAVALLALWAVAGAGAVRAFFGTHFADLLREAVADATEINPKGELQELTQRLWQDQPEYALLSAEGPPHRRRYRVGVSHRGVLLAEGEGTGIRRAESAAAAAALAVLRKADAPAARVTSEK